MALPRGLFQLLHFLSQPASFWFGRFLTCQTSSLTFSCTWSHCSHALQHLHIDTFCCLMAPRAQVGKGWIRPNVVTQLLTAPDYSKLKNSSWRNLGNWLKTGHSARGSIMYNQKRSVTTLTSEYERVFSNSKLDIFHGKVLFCVSV